MIRPIALAFILFLAACDAGDLPEASHGGPLPKKICNEVNAGLAKLQSGAPFEYDAKGEATVEEQIWIPMPTAQRDQIAQMLAFHVACQSQNPAAEQKVTIRAETGRVLLDRIVETRPDIGALIEE